MFAYLGEFLGTFLFLLTILVVGEPIPIVVSLLGAIYAFGKLSGGHFNSTISIMQYAHGKISLEQLIGYVLAQVVGGLVALLFYKASSGKLQK